MVGVNATGIMKESTREEEAKAVEGRKLFAWVEFSVTPDQFGIVKIEVGV